MPDLEPETATMLLYFLLLLIVFPFLRWLVCPKE